jgi:hypothetical protein
VTAQVGKARRVHVDAPRLDDDDAIARRLLPALRSMVRAEVEQVRPPVPRVVVSRPDTEIMAACHKVALAADRLAQAKFSGTGEIAARQALIRTATTLGNVMKRHGRMP